ncbi:hypothetical protein [Mameliella alba]|uniref:hypothetical protein n=1 Tax=Mameliella alba TaxID=561184 RepID=UPI0010544D10|nr:hypothetical protein [Mameliella alba]
MSMVPKSVLHVAAVSLVSSFLELKGGAVVEHRLRIKAADDAIPDAIKPFENDFSSKRYGE